MLDIDEYRPCDGSIAKQLFVSNHFQMNHFEVCQDNPTDRCNTKEDFNFERLNANNHSFLFYISLSSHHFPLTAWLNNRPNRPPLHQSNVFDKQHVFRFIFKKGSVYNLGKPFLREDHCI